MSGAVRCRLRGTFSLVEQLKVLAERLRQDRRLIACDDFEVVVERRREERRGWTNGVASRSELRSEWWYALRLVHRKRPGLAVVRSGAPGATSDLVDRALRAAAVSLVDPWFRFPIWRRDMAEPSPAEAPPLPNESLRGALEMAAPFFEERYRTWVSERVILRKGEKMVLADAQSGADATFLAALRDDTGAVQARGAFEEQLPLLSRETLLRRAAALHVEALASADAERLGDPHLLAGRCLLSPQAVASLLVATGHWWAADRMLAAASPFAPFDPDKPFSFAPCVSILDDGLRPTDVGGGRFDREGVTTQRTALVTRGAVVGWLHDTYTAARENCRSTGSRWCGEGFEPGIAPNFLELEASDVAAKTLRHSLRRGLYVQRLARPRPTEDGHFHLEGEVSGWLIEDGQAAAPFRPTRVVIDVPKMWQSVAAVGSDRVEFPRAAAPSILVEKMPMRIQGFGD